MELAFLPATEQARLVREREVSPVELVELSLARIERLDSGLGAFVTVRGGEALAEARSMEGAAGDGPFHGVPIALKDLDTTRGIRTTFSSPEFAEHVPDFDLAHVARTRAAGFVVVGKTNTPEFGTTAFTDSELNGPARTPWDRLRNAGGSSGGAAAAVAAGLVPVAQGSDGGGSIRIPASCCGLFGLKPSRGRVSNAPYVPGIGLGSTGPLARTVLDAAAYLDVVRGYEWGDPFPAPEPERPFVEEVGADPGRLRVALTTASPLGTDVDPACAAAAREAAELLASLGHEVEEAAPDWGGDGLMDDFLPVWQSIPALYPVRDPSRLSPLNRWYLDGAAATPAPVYAGAIARLQLRARRIAALWQSYDAGPAARAGGLGDRARRPARPVRPGRPLHALHRRLQRHRPARRLAAAALDGRRPAARRPPRRAAVRGRAAPPRFGPARGGTPLGRPAPPGALNPRRRTSATVIPLRERPCGRSLADCASACR
jgi:amidase